MARLSAQLQYFVAQKMTSDARWRSVKVIFSGHEVYWMHHGLRNGHLLMLRLTVLTRLRAKASTRSWSTSETTGRSPSGTLTQRYIPAGRVSCCPFRLFILSRAALPVWSGRGSDCSWPAVARAPLFSAARGGQVWPPEQGHVCCIFPCTARSLFTLFPGCSSAQCRCKTSDVQFAPPIVGARVHANRVWSRWRQCRL